MITSKRVESDSKKATMNFPVIVEYTVSGLVVLLTGHGHSGKYAGMVVSSIMEQYPVGYYAESWWKGGFKKIEGQLILTNGA